MFYPRIFYAPLFAFLLTHAECSGLRYHPTWTSLDSRPLPEWYDEAKIGIFIHWGVYAVPSVGSEWFWINWHNNVSYNVQFMKDNYKPGFTYQDFAKDFTAEFFNPNEWADLFQKSGAQYIIFTSKHHEGYTMWPSKYSFSWNSVDIGPHKDIIGLLAESIRNRTDIHFGLYHSLFEWFNPQYLYDKGNEYTTQLFVKNKVWPEMIELVERYKPDIIWSDGEWEANSTYWKSKEFLAWLYNESPVKDTVVTNDRWGSETLCKHGGFLTCSDRFNPGVLQKKKWENALTIDSKSWGFRRNAKLEDYLNTDDLISLLASTISCNGNIAVNIGPTKDGMISPIYQERLLDLGKWLKVNGDAVYKSKPWSVCQNDTDTPGVWYTIKKTETGTVDLYAIVLDWPESKAITLACPKLTSNSTVTMLGVSEPLQWTSDEETVEINFPDYADTATHWAWTLKMDRVSNIWGHSESINVTVI